MPNFCLEKTMRHTLALVAAVCLFNVASVPGIAAQQAQPARPVADTPPTMTSIDDVLVAVREDLQADRADVMSKSLSLTADQAAKFWPVYNAYQKEQNVIMDEQLKGVQRYIESADTLNDADGLALMTAHLDRDAKMASLRQKALGDFQRVVGAKLAARALQIDRRLSLLYQLQMVTKLPLIH
jgi:Spy/CpxP family protein refolding chaperone